MLAIMRNDTLTVVVFADTILGPNGVRTFYRTLRKWARRTGEMRVVVISPVGSGDTDDNADAEVFSVRPDATLPNPIYPGLLLGYYRQSKLRAIVEQIENPSVIHIATSGPLGVAGARLARKLHIPTVGMCLVDTLRQCIQPYFGFDGRFARSLARFVDRRAYKHCRAMSAPSETAAQSTRTFYDGNVEVIPLPVDVDFFRPAENREGAFRRKYGADGKVLAVVIGRMAKEKNLDPLCEHLLGDDRIRTVFVGDGPYSDHLRQRWNARVIGFLQGDDLLAAFQQADLFVQLSVAETFGLSLVEAMASGLPAIVMRGRGVADVLPVDSGVEVILPEELPSLADRCARLVADKAAHRRRSLAVRAFAERLSPDIILPAFVALHRSVLSSASETQPALLQEAKTRRADLLVGTNSVKEKTRVH